MEGDTYLKDAVDRVLEVLKDAFGGRFKEYINGLMDEIPESMLPLIMATSSDGTVSSGATGTDDIVEKIVIVVALNHKDYIGSHRPVAEADLALRRLVMAQDPTSRQYLPETVMYALRRNFTLDGGIVDNNITFDFSPVRRGESLYTQEATLTLNVQRMALVPVRN